MQPELSLSFCHIREQSSISLVAQLCTVQKYSVSNNKDLEWYKPLRCLQLPQDASQKGNNPTLDWLPSTGRKAIESSVAVSWRWNTSKRQKNVFKIRKAGRIVKSDIDFTIMKRILRFVQYAGADGLWIDSICVDQKDEIEKWHAMQSMDLVYRFSAQTVGVLTVPIRSRHDMSLLYKFMRQKWLIETCHGVKLRRYVRAWMALQVVELLEHLLSDEWWQRAWIYQEELCAAEKMKLLFPIKHKVHKTALQAAEFGDIEGEVVISAQNFRKTLTKFCNAYRSKQGAKWRDGRGRSQILLKRAAWHNWTHKAHEDLHSPAPTWSFSHHILEDLRGREVTEYWDMLPILANCCGYSRRLDGGLLNEKRFHISVCILTQALLNGEILDNRTIISNSQMCIYDLFKRIFFQKFKLPVTKQHFLYIKRCRWKVIDILNTGVRVRGHLWRVVERVVIAFTSFERTTANDTMISRLYTQIQNQHPVLAAELEKLVTRLGRIGPGKIDWHGSMMADIAHAIQNQQPLAIAAPIGEDVCRAVFVINRKTTHLFTTTPDTSWELNADRYIEKRSSLAVTVEGKDDSGHRLLRTDDWVNGLEFGLDSSEIDVIFPWPRGMSQL